MTQAYAQLIQTVHEMRQLWRFRRMAEGMLLTAAVCGAAVMATTMLDQLLSPGRGGRLLLAVMLWTVAGASLWLSVVRPLRIQHSDDYFAALLERAVHGAQRLGNRFINALQLGREYGDDAPPLVQAIVRDGAALTEELDYRYAVSSTAMKRHGVALGVSAIIVAGWFAMAGPFATTSFARVLLPLAEIAPYTQTRVEIVSPRGQTLRVLEGSVVRIEAQTHGLPADRADLHWTDAAGQRRVVRMESLGRDRFASSLTAATGMSLHVSAGDGRSRTIHLQVDPRPRVESMHVRYTPPAYTGRQPAEPSEFDGHLSGLPQTQAHITFRTNKPLAEMILMQAGRPPLQLSTAGDDQTWTDGITLTEPGSYSLRLIDADGYDVTDPARYTIILERDAPPSVAFVHPGRDIQVRPGDEIDFHIVAQDDHGLAQVRLLGRVNDNGEPRELHAWSHDGQPPRNVKHELRRSVAELGLQPGQRLTYWAQAIDRNDVSPDGPGQGESRRYHLLVLTPEAAAALMASQLTDYAKVIEELIRLQRLNRAQTQQAAPADELLERQSLLRRQTMQLAQIMERNAFPGRTIIDELRGLASGEMVQVIGLFEGYRDATALDAGRRLLDRTIAPQDAILASLESILHRLNRNEQVSQALRRLQRTEPQEHQRIAEVTARLAEDFDAFLVELRELSERYEKLSKRDDEDITADDLEALAEVRHRFDRWGRWAKDSVDEILKLPDGFVKDSHLAETLNTIFEEIEQKVRSQTREIATPIEEGIKALAEQVPEDLEMWMPEAGDSVKWVMEDPTEGRFEVPEAPLPSSLQDMVGDLIEDMADFDEEADDVTGGWGGNMQVGWDIADGPISSYAALGKTGNQLPNASEMGGRSGAGRRGRSSGQMVGADSPAMEGRPTPARVTAEPYEAGQIDAQAQLDPRGATGGGRKTGGGERGLQGGTPPDFVADMQRLAERQRLLREQSQQIARQLDQAGRPSDRVNRAIDLMTAAESDLRDLRYDDAARRRKDALAELRSEQAAIDRAVSMTLQRAMDLPADLRDQVRAGSRQPLPEGYEDLVGAYYKALAGQE